MGEKVLEIVQNMDLKDLEAQIALQCAPLITGLKISNLLIIPKENLHQVQTLLKRTQFSYCILGTMEKKATLLLFRKDELEEYLSQQPVNSFFRKMGYDSVVLADLFPIFRSRYMDYIQGNGDFPHEMGLLLGYPIADVEGFIENQGRDFLYAGCWKVYENVSEKIRLFQQFEASKERLLQLVALGVKMIDIINTYYNVTPQQTLS